MNVSNFFRWNQKVTPTIRNYDAHPSINYKVMLIWGKETVLELLDEKQATIFFRSDALCIEDSSVIGL